jgi:sugar phosphate isomerase/epimerase
MHIAINTASLDLDTPTALARAKALGFDFVEINLQPAEFGYDYRRRPAARFYRELRAQMDDLALEAWSTTALPLTQPQMFFERARRDILMGGAVAAGILGSRVFVAEPADIFTSEMAFNAYLDEQLAAPVIEGYDEAWVQAVNRRVTLALRNIDYWLGIVLTNQVDRMSHITRDLAIGSALDVPLALHRNKLHNWLEALADRLAVAYVYDMDDDGQIQAPQADAWRDWLPALASSPLKCAVMRAHRGQTAEEISASRAYLQDILS